MLPRTPRSTLFPYTTLFRSGTHEEPPFGAVDRGHHDALVEAVVVEQVVRVLHPRPVLCREQPVADNLVVEDRKSTRLNSSHVEISYAVFCLKKKKKRRTPTY